MQAARMTRDVKIPCLGKILVLAYFLTDSYNIGSSRNKAEIRMCKVWCVLVDRERDGKQLKKVANNRGVSLGWPTIGLVTLMLELL